MDLFFSSWLRGWLVPPACLACDGLIPEAGWICEACDKEIEDLGGNCCSCCAEPFSGKGLSSHLCGKCLKTRPAFQKVWAGLIYRGPLVEVLHGIKFGKNPLGLKVLIPRALPRFRQACEEFRPDEILAVPLSSWRRFRRGFNQSYLLAHYLLKADHQHIPLRRWVRRRHTRAQARQTRSERLRALKNVFSLPRPARILGKKILIVDDVMTTGATGEALSRCLLQAGAKEVGVYVLARTPKDL